MPRGPRMSPRTHQCCGLEGRTFGSCLRLRSACQALETTIAVVLTLCRVTLIAHALWEDFGLEHQVRVTQKLRRVPAGFLSHARLQWFTDAKVLLVWTDRSLHEGDSARLETLAVAQSTCSAVEGIDLHRKSCQSDDSEGQKCTSNLLAKLTRSEGRTSKRRSRIGLILIQCVCRTYRMLCCTLNRKKVNGKGATSKFRNTQDVCWRCDSALLGK